MTLEDLRRATFRKTCTALAREPAKIFPFESEPFETLHLKLRLRRFLRRNSTELKPQPGHGFLEHLFFACCPNVQPFVRCAGHPRSRRKLLSPIKILVLLTKLASKIGRAACRC